jgi:hypothetical protein
MRPQTHFNETSGCFRLGEHGIINLDVATDLDILFFKHSKPNGWAPPLFHVECSLEEKIDLGTWESENDGPSASWY